MAHIDLDFISEWQSRNTTWGRTYLDPNQKPIDSKSQTMWSFTQFTHMVTRGLDAMFRHLEAAFVNEWVSIYKEPAPNLDAVFNLSGRLNDEPETYTKYLKDKIRSIGNNHAGCSPVFKSLSLIAPQNLSSGKNHLVDLFQIIDQQKKAKVTNRLKQETLRYPNALSEITLYNIDIDNYELVNELLNQLELLARREALQVLILIPAWDRAAFTYPKIVNSKPNTI
ncbi:MAG: hypothetical protein ACRCXC_12140 [Legionella sp.]